MRFIGVFAATVYLGLVAAFSVLYLYASSVPGAIFVPWIISVFGIVGCGIVWVLVFLVSAWRSREKPEPVRPKWLMPLALLPVLLIALSVLNVPTWLRFISSKSELTFVAEELIELDSEEAYEVFGDDLSVGYFDFYDLHVVDEGLLFYESQGGFLDDTGLAYLPTGEKPPGHGSFERPKFRWLGGGWYTFTASW